MAIINRPTGRSPKVGMTLAKREDALPKITGGSEIKQTKINK
jgi:hypothetical protein